MNHLSLTPQRIHSSPKHKKTPRPTRGIDSKRPVRRLLGPARGRNETTLFYYTISYAQAQIATFSANFQMKQFHESSITLNHTTGNPFQTNIKRHRGRPEDPPSVWSDAGTGRHAAERKQLYFTTPFHKRKLRSHIFSSNIQK